MRGFELVLSLVLAMGIAPHPAYADDAAAKALFDQGKTLFAEGKYGEACAKLEASFKLSALSSTRGLLGACYEKVGKLASAWAAYRDSAAIAERQGHTERAQAARDKANELEPKLAKLAIDTKASSAVKGLEVSIDGVVQPGAALDQPLPIDGGPHVIAADARGYAKWETTVDIVDGEQQQTSVPMLVADPKELEAPGAAEQSMSRGRKIALGVTGGGVATLAVAGVFGMLAKIDWDGAECDDAGLCATAQDKSKADTARRDANIATVVGAVGIVAVGTGVVLWLRAPKYETTITPVATNGGVAIVIGGQF